MPKITRRILLSFLLFTTATMIATFGFVVASIATRGNAGKTFVVPDGTFAGRRVYLDPYSTWGVYDVFATISIVSFALWSILSIYHCFMQVPSKILFLGSVLLATLAIVSGLVAWGLIIAFMITKQAIKWYTLTSIFLPILIILTLVAIPLQAVFQRRKTAAEKAPYPVTGAAAGTTTTTTAVPATVTRPLYAPATTVTA